MSAPYIKDKIIQRVYSGRKQKSKVFVCHQGSSYHDAEISSQLISCLHDAIIHAAPRIGRIIDKLELYRQCPPRRLKETNMS